MSRGLTIAAVGVGLLLLAGVALVLVTDSNWFRGFAERQTMAATGRDVSIRNLDIDFAFTPRVVIEGLSVDNAPWGDAPELAAVERLELTIDLKELLRWRVVLPEVIVTKPELFLEKNQDGQANWALSAGIAEEVAHEAVVPDDRTEVPIIGHLEVENGTFQYLDPTRGVDLSGTLSSVVGEGGGGERFELSGEGQFEKKSFRLELSGGALIDLRNESKPYPVDLTATIEDIEVSISGTLTRPLQLAGFDLRLGLSGQNLADLFPLVGMPLPPTAPYRLSGHLTRDGDLWRFEDFDGRVGESDLRGTGSIQLGREPPLFEVDAVSNKLDFADLAGLIGAEPPGTEEADDGLLIPDREISLHRLRGADGRVALKAKRILAPGLPIDDLEAELSLQDGILRLQPADLGVAGGSIRLFLSLYGTQDPVQIDALAHVRDLQLKDAFRGSEFVQEMGGRIDGSIELSGRGNSLHEMLAASDGNTYLVMSDGQISGLIVELVGLDVVEALALQVGGDAKVPIRCLVVDLDVQDGVAKSNALILDTTDTLIEAEGQLYLDSETLEFTLTPRPKDVSLLTFRSKVHIEGPLADLSIAPDAASILGFLPPVDLGTAEDAPCRSMIERARAGNK